jgi:hypothetical protein
VLISNESKKISQFYVVKSDWDKTNDLSKKITPLAHIHMSNSTGNIKVVLYQPEIWNISNKSKELISFIKSISPATETTLVH